MATRASAASTALLLAPLILLLCLLAPPCWSLASGSQAQAQAAADLGNWGSPGRLASGRDDSGPPARCLPPPSPPDLDSPYDVYDTLLVNALTYLAERSGAQPLFPMMNALSLAAWDAVSPYDCAARPIMDTGIPRRPPPQRTQRHRNRADLVDPPLAAVSRHLMAAATPAGAFLLSPNCSGAGVATYDTPECVGRRAAETAYDQIKASGYNLDGKLSRSFNAAPFEDYTGYVPRNTPWELSHRCNWQPLHMTDGGGKFWIQYPLLAHLGRGNGAAMTLVNKSEVMNRSVPMWDCEHPTVYKAEVDEVLAASAALNDTTKAVTEFLGGLPWWLLAMQQLRAPRSWSTTDLLAFNLVQVLQTDALVLVMKEKYVYDAVRPVSAVRWLYGNTNVTAYGGSGVGTTSMPARDWLPYLNAQEPEYPSGTACWCRLFTEWLQLWQGGAEAITPPIIFGWPKGCSLREPEASPAADTYFPLLTMAHFRKTCQDARVIGGVHFRAGVKAGDELCAGLAGGVWGKVKALYPKLAGGQCPSK
ncbi:hypothetical protein HYH03_000826 [Edaphochlamys debaryana]|uniref:Uncharacterized protein n=1 Tax=Edaphochlamys debaryana TaxID=47281 RepID=A0A835YM19_9CHLO|nr:hypothetical protein HYH03_000826 [Edaphochlamys debaryana]|eukprot:KAG2501005.1 hypothetical protein HYH03_000826 [Edaphochlamys debaryana]